MDLLFGIKIPPLVEADYNFSTVALLVLDGDEREPTVLSLMDIIISTCSSRLGVGC